MRSYIMNSETSEWKKSLKTSITNERKRVKMMGVSASCVFLWGVYLFLGIFPLIYVTVTDKRKGVEK